MGTIAAALRTRRAIGPCGVRKRCGGGAVRRRLRWPKPTPVAHLIAASTSALVCTLVTDAAPADLFGDGVNIAARPCPLSRRLPQLPAASAPGWPFLLHGQAAQRHHHCPDSACLGLWAGLVNKSTSWFAKTNRRQHLEPRSSRRAQPKEALPRRPVATWSGRAADLDPAPALEVLA